MKPAIAIVKPHAIEVTSIEGERVEEKFEHADDAKRVHEQYVTHDENAPEGEYRFKPILKLAA